MKPFDLAKAKAGDPILDSGRNIVFFVGAKQNGLVVIENQYGTIFTVPTSQIFMAPKKRTVWVNFYENVAYYYDSMEEADNDAEHFSVLKRISGKAYPVKVEA